MSRIANSPVPLPSGVNVDIAPDPASTAAATVVAAVTVTVKGPKGSLTLPLSDQVEVKREDGALRFAARSASRSARALAGTTRSLLKNMVTGVSEGFEKRLELQGVGYRAQAQGRRLNLQLGFSHPVEYALPDGINVETTSQTQIVVKGIDKQLVGQVAAEIRGFRPPEPYKGKGVRYVGERVRRKEGKKK